MSMIDEPTDVMRALATAIFTILAADTTDRERIGEAFLKGRSLRCSADDTRVAIRLRAQACYRRFAECRLTGDVSHAGWLLAAVQERAEEADLSDWQGLHAELDKAVLLLQLGQIAKPRSTRH